MFVNSVVCAVLSYDKFCETHVVRTGDYIGSSKKINWLSHLISNSVCVPAGRNRKISIFVMRAGCPADLILVRIILMVFGDERIMQFSLHLSYFLVC
jgi:hypothetical protein